VRNHGAPFGCPPEQAFSFAKSIVNWHGTQVIVTTGMHADANIQYAARLGAVGQHWEWEQ